MRRIKLSLEYDGTNYVGWQQQSNGPSVQENLEAALLKVTAEQGRMHSSGRTDSGVHALGQVVHFSTDSAIDAVKFPAALNSHLPDDIAVVDGEYVADDFHAQYDAKWKWYRYTLLNRKTPSALHRNSSYRLGRHLDVDAMCAAALCFEGEKDFRAFCAEPDRQASTVRTLYHSRVSQHHDFIYFDCVGSGFLYNMVRVLQGTLLAVAYGDITLDQLQEIQLGRQRDLRCATVPGKGLCLMHVGYEDFDFDQFAIVKGLLL